MKELVILSGKGGTGKTSITASLASLAAPVLLADCDVDAADLHLMLDPKVQRETDFWSGEVARVDPLLCTSCGECIENCRFDAISPDFYVDRVSCEGCGVCHYVCPVDAVTMEKKMAGKWYVSSTEKGTLVHARLNIAEDNSGKLVTEVKKEARRIAREEGHSLVIVDGPPGVGCPVISSLSGAGMVLVVTEPSVSGIHDLKRVLELARHFHVKPAVLINKYDINEEKTTEIEKFCRSGEVPVVGRIGFDQDFTRSQVEAVPLVEYSDGEAARQVRKAWEVIRERLEI